MFSILSEWMFITSFQPSIQKAESTWTSGWHLNNVPCYFYFHFMSFHDSGLFLFFNPSVDLGAPVYSPPCHRLFSWSIPTPAPRLSNNCLFLYWFFHPLHVPPVLSHCTLLPLHFILFETFPICMVIIHMLAVRLFVHWYSISLLPLHQGLIA